jgi:hypothetical protein
MIKHENSLRGMTETNKKALFIEVIDICRSDVVFINLFLQLEEVSI